MDDKTCAICDWCNQPIMRGEAHILRDGDTMHLSCAAEEMQDATFDRDMEFGS